MVNLLFAILRLSMQAVCIDISAGTGLMLLHVSQLLTTLGGTAGSTLILNTLLVNLLEPTVRISALGKLAGVTMLGNALGYQLGGSLADYLGQRAPFVIAAATLGVSQIFVYLCLPRNDLSSSSNQSNSSLDQAHLDQGYWSLLGLLAPRSLRLQDGKLVRYYGVMLLTIGFAAVVFATAFVPSLLLMHSIAVFNLSPSQNSTLTSINSLLQSAFLILVFPFLVDKGRRWYTGGKRVESMSASSGSCDPAAVPSTPLTSKMSTEFDMLLLRCSVVVDAVFTGSVALASKRWHLYLGSFPYVFLPYINSRNPIPSSGSLTPA